MLDLTRDIKLSLEDYKTYRKGQALLYAFSVAVVFYLAFLVLFPRARFTYSFDSSGLRNTIDDPRDSASFPLDHGSVLKDNGVLFDVSPTGTFSGADISMVLDKDSEEPIDGEVEVRKSYRAFLYPDGGPVGFRDGSLLKNNGDYFIISDGKLRKFQTTDDLVQLGFSSVLFKEVSQEDLKFNKPGDNVTKEVYPDGTVFKIKDDFYFLSQGELSKFLSLEAFLTRYSFDIAIEKSEEIFSKFPESEKMVGFADGSTIAYGEGVYIVSGEKVFPVDLPETYVAKNYLWENLIPASADEFSNYKKDRIFTIRSPHPEGTVFFAKDSQKSYIIRGGQRHLLPTSAIATSWAKKGPIEVLEKSASTRQKCILKKTGLSMRTYGCRVALESFSDIPGSEYEFHAISGQDIKADSLGVVFFKDINLKELRSSIAGLYNRIKGTYNVS